MRGQPFLLPTGHQVLQYIHELWRQEVTTGVREAAQVQRMKKFTNFIGEGIGEAFLFEIRRVAGPTDFWRVCEHYLAHDRPMALPAAETQGHGRLP